MDLGGFKAHGVRCFNQGVAHFNKPREVYKEPPFDGLLGEQELLDYSAIIDSRALQLFLRKRIPQTSPVARAQAGELQQFLAQSGYTTIKLERCRNLNYVATVVVEGKRLRLVCDTGSPRSALDEKRTKSLNLGWERSTIDVPTDDNDDAKCCTVKTMEMEAFRLSSVKFHSMDMAYGNKWLEQSNDPPVDGILGWDVLRTQSGIIDMLAQRLYLRAPGP